MMRVVWQSRSRRLMNVMVAFSIMGTNIPILSNDGAELRGRP